jgi:hypothetical protein
LGELRVQTLKLPAGRGAIVGGPTSQSVLTFLSTYNTYSLPPIPSSDIALAARESLVKLHMEILQLRMHI